MRRAANPVNHATTKKTNESAPAEVKKPNNGSSYGNNKNGGYKGHPAMRAPRPQQDLTNASEETKVWQGFALSAPIQYTNDANAAATAPRAPPVEHNINDTFKVRGKPKAIEEDAAAQAPERKTMLPPHLRKKAEAAATE